MIFTFYSYKGGVGRSMALANVAQWLYTQGARVVTIDWDLEAPGLESFFYQSREDLNDVRSKPGLVDMLLHYKEQFSRFARKNPDLDNDQICVAVLAKLEPLTRLLHAIHLPNPSRPESGPALWLLTAGIRSSDRFSEYAEAVQDFDWADFYDSFQGEAYFGWLRRQLAPEFDESGRLVREGLADVVLIDSRTGVTEMGGVCTRQMADVVVAFCASNTQSLEGVVSMAKSFRREEILQANNGRPDVILVPTRVDSSELKDRDRFEAQFRKMEQQFQSPVLKSLKRSFWELQIPYVAKFAYEEALTVRAEGSSAKFIYAKEMESAYKQLAAQLVFMTPQESKLRKLCADELKRFVGGGSQRRVVIDYARKDGEEFARRLRERLEREAPDLNVWDRAQMEGGLGWWKQITDAIDSAESMVLVMSPSAMESEVVRKAWRYARQQGVCVYPVLGAPAADLSFHGLPRWMTKLHFFDLEKEWATFLKHLRSPCPALRVPFMAPDLPEGFVERPVELDRLRGHLLAVKREKLVAGTSVLRGAGGCGKTVLAARVCHDAEVIDAFDDGILWVTLGEQPNVLEELLRLCAALTGEHHNFQHEESAALFLSQKLEDRNCLIVIDDVWSAAHLKPFLRGAKSCARLMTTRNSTAVGEATLHVILGEATFPEAVQMLTRGLAPTNMEPFEQLAPRLGKWPLALSLAREVLVQRFTRGDTLEGALEYVNRALDKKGVQAFDRPDADDRHHAVGKTLEVSLKLLAPEDRQRLMGLAVLPGDTDIPLRSVGVLWDLDDFDVETLVQRLDSLSLLKLDLTAKTVRVHDLVRAYLASQLPDPDAIHGQLIHETGEFSETLRRCPDCNYSTANTSERKCPNCGRNLALYSVTTKMRITKTSGTRRKRTPRQKPLDPKGRRGRSSTS